MAGPRSTEQVVPGCRTDNFRLWATRSWSLGPAVPEAASLAALADHDNALLTLATATEHFDRIIPD